MENESSDAAEKQIPRTTLINRQRTKRNRILRLITSDTTTLANYGIFRSCQQQEHSENSEGAVLPVKKKCGDNRKDAGTHTNEGNCSTDQLNRQLSAADCSNRNNHNYSPIDSAEEWDDHSFPTNIGKKNSNTTPSDDKMSSVCRPKEYDVSDAEEFELTDNEGIDYDNNDDDGTNVSGDDTSDELPPHARKRLTLLVGIWVDNFHPNLNLILRPTVQELNELYETGIEWKNPIDGNLTTSKFITIVCTADSMARAPLLNMNLNNGKHGCTYCYAEGIQMRGPGVHRRYPYSDVLKCRTDAEMRKHMYEAYNTKLKVFGCKGLCGLLFLQGFDLHAGPDIDSMHNVYLGIAKLHTSLLLFGKSTDAWYMGKPANLKQINERLMKIRPPSRISRKPRPVEEWKNWKASEWRNWILYYAVPCLKGIIDDRDLKLLIWFSRATYILNGDSISTQDIDEARSLLKQYVQNFHERYGIINMKFNVHLLNHLVDTVDNWGPFWAHSAFPFESLNKKIIEKANNANSRALQIATRYLMVKFIEDILHDATVSPQLQDHLRKILTFQSKKLCITDKTLKFQGIKCDCERSPSKLESEAINSAGFNPQLITFYERAVIHNITYKRRAKFNEKITRYCDEFVYCRNIAKFARIDNIISFSHANSVINGVFVSLMDHLRTPSNTRQLQNVSISKTPKIFVSCEDNVLVPAIWMSNHKNNCIVRISNVWETD